MKDKKLTRRSFIAKSAIATAGATIGLESMALSPLRKRVGPNDKIRMGFIGVGNRGTQLMTMFMGNDDVEVAALCDIYEPYLNRDRSSVSQRYLDTDKVPPMKTQFGNDVKRYKDFRKLLEQKDIDAVCIATPDHWHAVQAIQAMEAGKDVYVEKPLTIALKEGGSTK
jgi:predicted dehydrogenase